MQFHFREIQYSLITKKTAKSCWCIAMDKLSPEAWRISHAGGDTKIAFLRVYSIQLCKKWRRRNILSLDGHVWKRISILQGPKFIMSKALRTRVRKLRDDLKHVVLRNCTFWPIGNTYFQISWTLQKVTSFVARISCAALACDARISRVRQIRMAWISGSCYSTEMSCAFAARDISEANAW
jgi:hypothetical protein